jgi:hypothetical protein
MSKQASPIHPAGRGNFVPAIFMVFVLPSLVLNPKLRWRRGLIHDACQQNRNIESREFQKG